MASPALPPLPCMQMIFPHSAASAGAPFCRTVFAEEFNGAACSPPAVDNHGRVDDSACSSFSSSSDLFMSSCSDNEDDDTGSSSASPQSAFGSRRTQEGPLEDMASLCAALPIKRGLSRHFSGKSQSFSSLARVSSIAELAKPENRYVKRRRTARIGADSMLEHHSYPPRGPSVAGTGISKRLGTSSRYKYLKSDPCWETALLEEGLAKCFSVPEF